MPPPQPQTQPYQQPETPQPQPYQSSQPQAYQQSTSILSATSNSNSIYPYIYPSETNNMHQGGLNQSSNYVMNPDGFVDNYKSFQDDKNTPNIKRLICQMILSILLLLIFSNFKYLYIFFIYYYCSNFIFLS